MRAVVAERGFYSGGPDGASPDSFPRHQGNMTSARRLTDGEASDLLDRIATQEPWHKRRYLETLRRVRPLIDQADAILDLGGRSPFTQLLELASPGRVRLNDHDLRAIFPYEDETFDLVFCLEVIEHIKDRETRDIGELSTFTFSGIRNCLDETRRVLRPGGALVVTTPNVCSYRSILNVLEGRHPFSYGPHNRELALEDLTSLVTEVGFRVEIAESFNAWSQGGRSRTKIGVLAAAMFCLGFPLRDREDALFVVARR